MNKLNRPIESYIREIERTIGYDKTIHLDETYTNKVRTILKQIVDNFGGKESHEKENVV